MHPGQAIAPTIIQSYWSSPSLQRGFEREAGGWVNRRYFLMCWALSALQLRRFYPRVELVTDSYGKELFIDKLQLPYTAVSTALDDLNYSGYDLWTAGKLHTYAMQQSPFLHLDGDVILFEPLGEHIEQAGIVAQHLEDDLDYYHAIWPRAEKVIPWMPPSIAAWREQNNSLNAYNMGTMGGQDIDFLQAYAQEAVAAVDKNLDHLQGLDHGPFSVSAEQMTYFCKAWQEQKEVTLVMPQGHGEAIRHNVQINRPIGYLHPIATFKRSESVCLRINNWLRAWYPEWHYRIQHLMLEG